MMYSFSVKSDEHTVMCVLTCFRDTKQRITVRESVPMAQIMNGMSGSVNAVNDDTA